MKNMAPTVAHCVSLPAPQGGRILARGGPSPKPRAQRGAAILTAMLTVTLVATLAATALWQQWRGLEVETAQRARVQSAWMLVGALDWARLILREDARSGGADHLGEPWAIPLEEARLSTFFASDTSAFDSSEDVMQAFISGRMVDLQSRLNVTSLVDAGKVSLPAVRAFIKLYGLLDLPENEIGLLAENLRFAMDTSIDNRNGNQAALLPQRVEQLVWLGVSPRSIALLKPYVTILPVRTAVNLNTASAEVLFASVDNLDMAGARRLVTTRTLAHFQTLADAAKILGDGPSPFAEGQHSVASRFFEVRSRLRLDQITVQERSVVQRDGINVKALTRERVSGDASLQ
jgi:general secretion pathway protein K